MADSGRSNFNTVDSSDGSITYRLVNVQGTRGQLMQYFDEAAYNDYHQEGYMSSAREVRDYRLDKENEANQLENTVDGDIAADSNPDTASLDNGGLIKVGDNVSNMFTSEEWQRMFDLFRKDNPNIFNQDTMRGFSVKEFKDIISDTGEVSNVNILNNLRERIKKGEKPTTLDEKGNDISVCG